MPVPSRGLSRIEFVSQRRTVLDDAETYLGPTVTRALRSWGKQRDWYEPILQKAEKLFARAHAEEGGEPGTTQEVARLISALTKSLAKTKQPTAATAGQVTRFVATATVNAATVAAAADDPDEDTVLEWVTMHDDRVRETHRLADGQQQERGAPFHVGGEEMRHPGDTSASPDEWIGCRCVLRPAKREDALVAATDTSKTSVIVALPHKDDPVHKMGPEPAHVTLAHLGDSSKVDGDAVNAAVAHVAHSIKAPAVEDNVGGRAQLGPNKADVLLMDGSHLGGIRHSLLQQPPVQEAHDAAQQHPTFTPHLTLGYPQNGDQTSPDAPDKVKFDRLAVWHGDQQTEHPLGGAPADDPDGGADEATESPAEKKREAAPATAALEAPAAEAPAETEPDAGKLIPWYGTLVVEGVRAGDKRRFLKGSLRNRDLPLPLTHQKASAPGHAGSVVVGRIDALSRIPGEDDNPNLVNGHGVFRLSPEADEAVGLVVDFGRFGVSIDADDFAAEETDEGVDFSDARICSASMVAIPAFAEANIMLGDPPPGWMGETVDAEASPEAIDAFPDFSNSTEEFGRGPGWATNPKGTARLHDYWTVPGQEGYEKIAWGTGGDFNRCRTEVGEEVGESDPAKLRFINAQCAQWHKDALGFWPATHAHMLGAHSAEDTAPSVNLVASAAPARWLPPTEWFSNPQLQELTPTTLVRHPHGTEIFGHLCDWQGCHTGFEEVCTPPPRAQGPNPYGYFHGGGLMTTDGFIPVGQLTLGGGHADVRMGWKAALAHYDDVSTVAADVRCGEDNFGIWFHGWLRPNLSEQQVVQFSTSRLSGDWRWINGYREFLLAHCVNGAGFPLARPQVAVHDGVQISLVAAGIVQGEPIIVEATQVDVEAAVEAALERREAKQRIQAAVQEAGLDPASRIGRLRAEFATED